MHPMDETLLGYALNTLDDDTRRVVRRYLRTHAEARHKLARLRECLAPLAADRDTIEPPTGLAQMTLARVRQAERLPAAPSIRATPTGGRSWWQRPDVLAAAASLLIAVGIGAAWVVSSWLSVNCVNCPALGQRLAARERGQVRQLEELYTSNRPGYGRVVKDVTGCCAYSPASRDAGGLLPSMPARPPSHDEVADNGNNSRHDSGQNALASDGLVRFCTTRTVGPDADDVYLNREQRVLAGLYPTDTAIAISDAVP